MDLPDVQGWSSIRVIGPGCQLSLEDPREAKRPEMAASPPGTELPPGFSLTAFPVS